MTDGAGTSRSQAWSAVHRTAWVMAAGGVGGAGFLAVLFLPMPVSPSGVFLGGAVLAVAMTLPFAEHPADRPARWFRLALAAGVGAVGLQGLVAWAGWWSLPIVGTLAATCPWLLSGFVRLWTEDAGSETPAAAPTVHPGEPIGARADMSLFEVMLEEVDAPPAGTEEARSTDPVLGTLDVDALCRLWLVSFARLREAPDSESVLTVTREREDLLDELGRRDPEGVAAWLADQPRATGDPRRYLRHSQGG